MENLTPEPATEIPPVPAPQPAEAAEASELPKETDPLAALATAAKAARLSPADEDRATGLLKERLVSGKAGITAAAGLMTDGLPWIVSVNAISAVWEQLSAPMRRHLLGTVAKVETEPARRLRLSLARAIFKLDPPTGLKLAATAAAALKDAETGALSSKHRQYFFNIFVGKGKPWLLQLPLGDLKPGEADTLVHAAIESLPLCPPLSQLSILRWVHGAGRFKKISAADLALAAKAVSRWNLKLQRQLKAEVAPLPPELESVLKPEASQPAPEPPSKPELEAETPAQPASSAEPSGLESAVEASQGELPAGEPPATEPNAETAPNAPEELVIPSRAQRLARKAGQKEKQRRETETERRKPEESRRPERGERPERSEKSPRIFDVKEALRGVESYIAHLRNELEQTKTQLRCHEKENRRSRPMRHAEPVPQEEIEALTRHNARLESTVAELRAQLEDLASHHEAIAESRLLHTGEPMTEGGVESLKSLLAIKLQEAFETYQAMRLEPLDKVFRLDYRDLLGSVFDVLLAEGVPLKKPAKNP